MVTAEARHLQDEHANAHRSAQQLKNPMFAHPHIMAAFSSKKKIARVLATIQKSLSAWGMPDYTAGTAPVCSRNPRKWSKHVRSANNQIKRHFPRLQELRPSYDDPPSNLQKQAIALWASVAKETVKILEGSISAEIESLRASNIKKTISRTLESASKSQKQTIADSKPQFPASKKMVPMATRKRLSSRHPRSKDSTMQIVAKRQTASALKQPLHSGEKSPLRKNKARMPMRRRLPGKPTSDNKLLRSSHDITIASHAR